LIPFVLLLPLVAAIIAIVADKDRTHARYIAFSASVVSLAMLLLIDSGTSSIAWFTVSDTEVSIITSVTPLSYILMFVVLIVGALVFAYSLEFMNLPSEWKRYYIELLAFEASMLAFAMAGNFILFFIAWEFLSLTSYLLIGFWHFKERANAAARKTVTIILIGDIALFASMVIIQCTFGTLAFSDLMAQAGSGQIPGIIGFLLVVAIATKSAQFPFQEWLPDAMEGPTPVSAYLHSSTMVKAGVFAAIILFPILQAASVTPILFAIGAMTALFGMFSAMQETHVKKVLAYSTVQEIGLMLSAVAVNALLAAVFFFFAQSFYKALLFFSSGVAIKTNDKEDLNELSGIRRNKIVYVTTLFGVLALAGFIPFGGFFANIGISSAFSDNAFVYLLMSLIGFGTSFYIFRWFFLQDKRAANPRIMLNYNAIPNSMTYGMVMLAGLSLAASAGFFLFPGIISNVGALTTGTILAPGLLDGAMETALVATGAFIGYRMYKQAKAGALKAQVPIRTGAYNFVYTANMFNDIYAGATSAVYTLAGGAAVFDALISDFFDWIGHVALKTGVIARMMATGGINAYVLIFVFGLLVILIAAFVMG
jgi:NADH-quinone oxidoreductase subunit L